MDIDTDEEEHSFEMHAPYIYKLTESSGRGVPSIIPIMISYGDSTFSDELASVLSGYLKDEENTFVISSDFCHWGSRFAYMAYTPTGDVSDLVLLNQRMKVPEGGVKIYKSIEALDKEAMAIASQGSSAAWKRYIKTTGNTICGQKPLGILMEAIEKVREDEEYGGDWAKFKWIGYSQSSRVISPRDSSVSYASGYAIA